MIICCTGAAKGSQKYLVRWITNHAIQDTLRHSGVGRARQFLALVTCRRLHSWRGLEALNTWAAWVQQLAFLDRQGRGGRELLSERPPPPLGHASQNAKIGGAGFSPVVWWVVMGSPQRRRQRGELAACSADLNAVGRGRSAAALFGKGWTSRHRHSWMGDIGRARRRTVVHTNGPEVRSSLHRVRRSAPAQRCGPQRQDDHMELEIVLHRFP
jgi:hypothetical protein